MTDSQVTVQLVESLMAAAASDDSEALRTASERLIGHLPHRPGTIEAPLARGVLDALRRNRRFGYMRRLAQAFIDDGCEDHRIIQHFAQALIEGGEALPAIRLLEGLAADPTISAYDWAEAKGALGRAWKDRAVRARVSRPDLAQHAIRQAFGHYIEPWHRDKANDYQGVNAVAVAAWDKGFALSPADLEATKAAARDIFQRLVDTPREKLQNWDFATAGEALLGMDRDDEAVGWYADYARREESAFALASTVRQLVQLWNIGSRSGGEALLATLTGKLGQLPGGSFSMSPEMLESVAAVPRAEHESLLGAAGALGYHWLQEGIEAAKSVALIRRNGKAHGTGFAIRGSDLDPGLGDELLVVTNAHVVSDPPEGAAAHPEETTVAFELLRSDGTSGSFDVTAIVWQSPSSQHDVAVLRLDRPVPDDVRPLKLHKRLPALKSPPSSRVYVIGHPSGREVSFSFQDNLLLDYERQIYETPDSRDPCRIHYRAPTEPGSSGSPVFDSNWGVIGVHHAGSPRWTLNGRREVYTANEGMWIEAIRRALAAARSATPPSPVMP